MKKFLLILAICVCAIVVNAQDVKIKGVPVTNKYEAFVRDIQTKGFTKTIDNGKSASFYDQSRQGSEGNY